MEVIVDQKEIQKFLHDFATGLARDPQSWRGWSALVLSSDPPLQGVEQGRLATALAMFLANYDGAVLWMDKCCFAVCNTGEKIDGAAFKKNLDELIAFESPHLMGKQFLLPNDGGRVVDWICENWLFWSYDSAAPPAPADLKSVLPRIDELMNFWEKTGAAPRERQVPNIMVVDDDALTRHMIGVSMARDHKLMMAQNVAEAVRKHILFTPDIVFLDIDLPDFDGFAFLDHVRRNDAACRVVMFSGNASLANRLRAFAAGADGFIAKPFDRQAFKQHIIDWGSDDVA